MRRAAALTAALAALLLARPAAPAGAETSFVPLPAFGTSPNEGNTYGFLPVVLFLDPQGAIRRLLAPSVTLNETIGINVTLRYFVYPEVGSTIELITAASTRGNREARILFEDPRRGPGGRYYLAGRLRYDEEPRFRFFGIGPNAGDEDETNFTNQDASLVLTGGLNVGRTWRLTLTERVRDYDVRPGGVPGLPFARERFPDVPGIEGAFTHAQRVDLVFDTRDVPSLTTEGGLVTIGFEVSSRALGSGHDFRRWVLDARFFVPVPRRGKRYVTVLHGALEAVDGRRVPFLEQATLGGEHALRGFGRNRFTDANSLLVGVEERIRLFTLRLFGTTSEWEVAPFGEVGKVFARARDLDLDDLAWSAGVGFRALVRPTVVGRLDIGIGPEGVATFVGLGLPF